MENSDVKIKEKGIMKRMGKLYMAICAYLLIAVLYNAWIDETTMGYRLFAGLILWMSFVIILLISGLYVWVRSRTEKSGIRESLILSLLAIAIMAMAYAVFLLLIQNPAPEERLWQFIRYS